MTGLLTVTQIGTTLAVTSETGAIVLTPPGVPSLVISAHGVQGPAGAGSVVERTAAAVIAAGQVARPNVSGQLVLAQADTTNNAKGAMVAVTGAAIGFVAQLGQVFVSLPDWNASTGAAALIPQTDYFLSPSVAGGLTSTVPASGVVLHIGTAIDTTTLVLSGSNAITL